MPGHGGKIACLIGCLILGSHPSQLQARELYLQEFQAKYEKNFQGNAEASKCTVCHPGLIKRSRNNYGKAVNQILTGRNVKDAGQIRAALTKAEKEPSDTPGKTFGDLIKSGVLPGTNSK